MYILSKTNEIKRYRYITNSRLPLSMWLSARRNEFIFPICLMMYMSDLAFKFIKKYLPKED